MSESTHPYPFYCPRFWHGMRPRTWWGLLREHRWRVHPSRWPMLLGVSLATPFNMAMGNLQDTLHRADLAEGELHGPPVFIIGHWRSGTTLLHELMVRDERFGSPSTFQCFAPHHFLVTQWMFRKFGSWLIPNQRPMDNMAAGWDRPQEDEFALMNLGLPSPYRRIAFPNDPPVDLDYLDFESIDSEAKQRWIESLRKFLCAVSISSGRPLVIKSPTHTGRIKFLAEQFPNAKFIHITRDPSALYPSTCRLWRSLDDVQSLQSPNHNGIEDYVVECFRRMYAAFHRDRAQIPPSRLIDVRYEDLIADPVAVVSSIYQTLHLADFESVRPVLQHWAETEHKAYQVNRHQLDPDTETKLREVWSEYYDRYNY